MRRREQDCAEAVDDKSGCGCDCACIGAEGARATRKKASRARYLIGIPTAFTAYGRKSQDVRWRIIYGRSASGPVTMLDFS